MNLTSFRAEETSWSLEATLPGTEEIENARAILPRGFEIFVNALPRIGHEEQLRSIRRIGEAGFTPVPHLSARTFNDRDTLKRYLGAAWDSGVRSILTVAGDIAVARGPFGSASDILDSGLLGGYGMESVGLAAYPAGHPWLDQTREFELLRAKIDTIRSAGLDAFLVSQFCFEAETVLAWIERIRRHGIDAPIRIGVPGPVTMEKLIRIALRCFVDLPLRRPDLGVLLARGESSARLMCEIETGLGGLPQDIRFHVFGFGGMVRTAQWMENLRIERAESSRRRALAN